jgi:hypothetical protein
VIHVIEFQERAQLVVVGDAEKKLYDFDDGAQGVRLHEFCHVRRGVEAAAVEELYVVLVQNTASGVGQGQVGEFPLFRERRGEPHIAQLFFHYIVVLNTKRWHDEDPSQRSVEPNRAFACEGPARAPGETAIRTALTGRPARRAHTVAAISAPDTPSANVTTQSFARAGFLPVIPAPHHYRHRQAGVAVRRGCRSVRPVRWG